jgi:TRAP-type uncharacterized transport system substrate-binding protein
MNPRTAPLKSAGDAMNWLESRIVYSMGFGVIVLLLAGLGLFFFSGPGSRSVVRIAYGAGGPVRKYFLEQMAAQGKRRNLDIRLVATRDTDQTLTLIDQHSADMGLIASAVEDRMSRAVLEVAPLYMEPLQLLVKADLYEPVLRDFGQLRGKTIDLDAPHSSTHLLASELLRFIGLADPKTGQPQYRPVYFTDAQLMDRQSDAPDAIFQIGGLPSPSIRNLITERNYRLVPLPFGGSFNLGKFRESELPEVLSDSNLRLNKSFVEESVIPAFVYSVLPAVPPTDTRTLATRLMLVGSKNLSNDVVRRVLEVVLSPEISTLVKPALTVELLNSSFQYERHPGTDSYLNSLKPFNVGGAFETYTRLVEIWGLLAACYVVGARGLKAWRARRRHLPTMSVGEFLGQVLTIEAAVHSGCTNAERIAFDEKLSEIKKASIELHLDGRLDDAESLPSLLVTLSDARTKIWGSVS